MEKLTATITEPKYQKCYALQKFPPYFICRTFFTFIILAHIYIHRSFTNYMKVTPSIYQLRTAIQYTSSHPSPHIPATNYNAMHKQVTPLFISKEFNTVHKNPVAQFLSQIRLGYMLRKPVSSRCERFLYHR